MRILITGCNGFLGSNIIRELFNSDYELIGTSLNDKKSFNNFFFEKGDLLNIEFVKSLIKFYNPDVIINTAALTDVDFCEKNPEEAYKLNVLTAENIAKAIEREDTKLIHISSDQLFEGINSFYSEEDTSKPINVYGKTKLEAENSCLTYHKNTVVVRTNFFGWSRESHKPTFAEWIFNSLKEGEEIKMFNDVFFNPIEISLLVKAIEKLFRSEYRGILNIAGNERISKYELGIKIAEEFGFDSSLIKSVKIDQSNFVAIRPLDMSLSIEKYEKLFDLKLPNVNSSLRALINNFPNKVKNLILGAGLSGLSLAYYLEKNDEKNYILLEAESEVGGLARSIRKSGFTFDFAPHMLHLRNEEIIQLIKELLGNELILNKRKGGILFRKGIIPYPFQHNLYYLDEEIRKECLNGAIEANNNLNENKPPKNFDEWIKMTLGDGIAKWFMRPYNKKCFCIDTKELTLDFLGRHVPSPSLEEIKQGAISDMSATKAGYYHQFYYPEEGGIDFLPKSIAKKTNNIKLMEKVIKIDLNKKIVVTDKSNYPFINLISTIPPAKLIELIEDAPLNIKSASKNIKFNSVCAVLLGINKPKISDYHFLYLPQEDILPYRITFPMNCSEKMTPKNMSSICAEYSYLGDKKFTDNEIIERTIKDLIKIGIIQDKEDIILKEIVKLNPAYAIFNFKRNENLELIKTYLNEKEIYTIGPFGKCEHLSMEEAILGGKELARELTKNSYSIEN